MARILVVGPTSAPWMAIAAEVEEDLERLRRPGVELTYRCTGAGPVSIRSVEDEIAAAPFVVQTIVDAAAEGFDAVIVDCTGDPGVEAARRLVSIPVIGPGEAMAAALEAAATSGPVCVLGGDELRSFDPAHLIERARNAATVVLGATGTSHVAAALRAAYPDALVLDPLQVALDDALRRLDQAFTATDFAEVSRRVIDHWTSGLDREWSQLAGTLEWSCWKTAEHVVDCVFSYALFLASRCQERYPAFGELDALPDATPADLIDGLRSVTTMLHAVIVTAEPDARAIIRMRPTPTTGAAIEFAARGAHELILHAHDIAHGLDLRLEPPAELCRRLFAAASAADESPRQPTDDPWNDLLVRSGRARVWPAD